MAIQQKYRLQNNVKNICAVNDMTLRSLALCVRQLGYPGQIDVVYGSLLRFVNHTNPQRLNVPMLLSICEVFKVDVGRIVEMVNVEQGKEYYINKGFIKWEKK